MWTGNIGAFYCLYNPDKPKVNAIIKYTKLLYQNYLNPSVWRCSERSAFSNKI